MVISTNDDNVEEDVITWTSSEDEKNVLPTNKKRKKKNNIENVASRRIIEAFMGENTQSKTSTLFEKRFEREVVQCPICNKGGFSKFEINLHVDHCLEHSATVVLQKEESSNTSQIVAVDSSRKEKDINSTKDMKFKNKKNLSSSDSKTLPLKPIKEKKTSRLRLQRNVKSSENYILRNIDPEDKKMAFELLQKQLQGIDKNLDKKKMYSFLGMTKLPTSNKEQYPLSLMLQSQLPKTSMDDDLIS